MAVRFQDTICLEDSMKERKMLGKCRPTDESLVVEISAAQNETDRVKFTIHTKTTLPEYAKSEFSVVRYHEEFIWLHECLEEAEHYEGYVIPPVPPTPNFATSRETTQKLREREDIVTKEEYNKMKQEIKVEYLATFKKTVATHDMLLQRLANHPVFRSDENFRMFLEYERELPSRVKNRKEKLAGLISNISKSADDLFLLHKQNDVDEFFEHERNVLVQYHDCIKDATLKSDTMTKTRKKVAKIYIEISSAFAQLATIDVPELGEVLGALARTFEKARKIEERLASDKDLKLSDTLRYYKKDSAASKDLLNRRLRCLANYVAANRVLEKARANNKDTDVAEDIREQERGKFEAISKQAKPELESFKTRMVTSFQKSLVELAELESKHSKEETQLLKNCLMSLR